MIILRALQIKDAEGMLEWMHDSEIQQNFKMETLNKTYEDVISFIQNAATELSDGKSLHFAIADEQDEYLGTISLKDVDLIAKKAEYSICLRRKAQGQGVAVKATDKLLQMAFEQFGLQRVYLNVLADNKKAIHLYVKCGFSYEGEFRKHLYLRGEYKDLKWYGILKEEYIQMKSKVC